jgi:hypothetical protein
MSNELLKALSNGVRALICIELSMPDYQSGVPPEAREAAGATECKDWRALSMPSRGNFTLKGRPAKEA